MICQDCGVEAETKHVAFHQNIGALFVRFPKSVQGRLCKSCIHKHFWAMTTTTLFLGWWGTISFLVTPFFIFNNVGRYLLCLGMPAVPIGAAPPSLSDAEVERIRPYAQDLFNRLNDGEDFETAAIRVADRAGVTPAQIALFVHAVVQSQQQE
ncbi:MAG: hypothetical protein WEB58_12925 [Planctomycetaceae bacterium]